MPSLASYNSLPFDSPAPPSVCRPNTAPSPHTRGRRNTSFVSGQEIKPSQLVTSSITRGMCLETIISRAPSKAIQSDQEFMDTNSAEHVCLCPLPLDMSVSSLILGHDKDHNSNSNSEDYPFLHHYPSLSSFCFERKNYEDPNQDSDLEMGSKSSVSSRGRLVPSSLTSFPTLPYPALPCVFSVAD
jgi:hypothetical protein